MISQSFWRGKSVVVTGGSSGIGRAAALALGAAGARVGLIARRREPLVAAVAAIRATGGVAEGASADVADAAALRAAVADLERGLGACAVAIASAGIHRVSWPLDAASAAEVIDVNVKGCINLAAAALPAMLARHSGCFCGVASIAGVVGLPGNAAYCGSKAAVIAFLESLRLDAGPAGVTITTALPGVVDTPMITAEERAGGGAMTATAAAATILRAIERGRAEVWFPRRTAVAAWCARLLPPALRDPALRRQPRLEEPPPGG
ncbi:MAG: SDR family NAD(P)-dependent oxidoreductase [Planctomycetaceae bacterium]